MVAGILQVPLGSPSPPPPSSAPQCSQASLIQQGFLLTESLTVIRLFIQLPCFLLHINNFSPSQPLKSYTTLFFFLFLIYFLYSRFLLVIYFIHISVYMSIPISQFIPPPPPPPFSPLVSIRLFSTSVSLFLPCKPVHLYHFSRFHIYALIYDICFSLSDLLHSV